MIKSRGFLLILSSPSGAGKSSLARALIDANQEFKLSISATTRPQRKSETDGKDYHFFTQQQMEDAIKNNEFLETAQVFGYHYGTLKKPIFSAIEQGEVIVCDIDWQGAESLRQQLKQDQVSVFILPPSLDELHHRLTTRARDSQATIQKRFKAAPQDINHWEKYDYIIINDDFKKSLRSLNAISHAEQARRHRLASALNDFIAQFKKM